MEPPGHATFSLIRHLFNLRANALGTGTAQDMASKRFCGYSSLWQEYEKALKYIRGLLKTEPGNTQALELEKLINKAMQKGQMAWLGWEVNPFPSLPFILH